MTASARRYGRQCRERFSRENEVKDQPEEPEPEPEQPEQEIKQS